ncbi:MAG: hypothetical protein A2Z71_03325 [Chloroflexi bacterium RBG_13_50_21]|nr:MAG: hypothetical protein A2Z71_03325 [Chloroflexi bacterium RBG_13_50_21]
MPKKTAMVQSPPQRVEVKPPPVKARQVLPTLEQILRRMGNNRAYTVINHKGNVWVVHFEGDVDHTTIT